MTVSSLTEGRNIYEFYVLVGTYIQFVNRLNSAGIQKQLQTIRLHPDCYNGDRRPGAWLSVDDITDVMNKANYRFQNKEVCQNSL